MFLKLLRHYLTYLVAVAIAAHCQLGAYLSVLGEHIADVHPEFALRFRQYSNVAQDEESLTGARQSNADSVGCAQEAHIADLIIAHQRQNDDVVFLALVVVHGGDVDAIQRTKSVLILASDVQGAHLGCIGGEHSDLMLLDTLLAQEVGQPKSHHGFVAIKVAATIFFSLFFVVVIQKEDVTLK